MQFDLVSPERRLASLEVEAVIVPGAAGDMTIMEGHVPAITTLRPGIVRAEGAQGPQEFVVTGGFAEIGAAGISVLAELAVPKSEATSSMFDDLLAAGRDAATTAQGENKDSADKYVADLEATKAAAGL